MLHSQVHSAKALNLSRTKTLFQRLHIPTASLHTYSTSILLSSIDTPPHSYIFRSSPPPAQAFCPSLIKPANSQAIGAALYLLSDQQSPPTTAAFTKPRLPPHLHLRLPPPLAGLYTTATQLPSTPSFAYPHVLVTAQIARINLVVVLGPIGRH